GADSRCASWNTSSKSAFIRVARPGDTSGILYINLKVLNTPFGRDPIDSLQVLFNNIMTPVNNFSNEIPGNFSLSQNFPNPFNPKTIINYELPTANYVTLKVYDVLGNEVKTIVNEKETAGSYAIEFDASGFPSGIYYYKIKAGEFEQVKKMILLK
ncbi:MAG: T9SS type A sorting domain-containing protein, partial [bacterium]